MKRGSLPYALSSGARLRVYSVAHRNVAALVRAEALGDGAVVIAQRAGMQLHHQPVVDRHARHLHQHVRLEVALIGAASPSPAQRLRKQRLRGVGRQPSGVRLDDRVVGRRGAERLEERPDAPASAPTNDEKSVIARPDAFASASSSARQPGMAMRKTPSGRKVGTTRPPHPDSRMARCASSESLAASVVASTSMLNRSNSARGRNSGDASRSAIWS